jgi:hypothetical protein
MTMIMMVVMLVMMMIHTEKRYYQTNLCGKGDLHLPRPRYEVIGTVVCERVGVRVLGVRQVGIRRI